MSTDQYADIFRKVEDLLRQTSAYQGEIQDNTELVDDLGLDSLKVMEMLHDVEDAFDITYPLNNLAELRTVKDFALQIQQLIGQNQ